MNIFRQLTAKPWVATQAMIDDFHVGGTFFLSPAKLGLRVLLAAVTVLFSLLIFAYGMRMELEVWRPSPQMSLLWLNTVLLVLSSLAMQWALFPHGATRLMVCGSACLPAGFLPSHFWAGRLWRGDN